MTLNELKYAIENNTLDDRLLILIINKNADFVAHQYINQIAKNRHLTKRIIDDISTLVTTSNSFFDDFCALTELNIYFTSEFKELDNRYCDIKNLIIVTDKINKDSLDIFLDYAVSIPEISEMCIKDYMTTNAPGLNTESVDWLYKLCNADLFRIEQEIDKLKSIDVNNQQTVFNEMQMNNAFSDLTDLTIFNLTNAIQKHDTKSVGEILKHIQSMDVDAFGLCTILHNAFKNILAIQCGKGVTPAMLGIKENQFKALKWSCNKYSNKQLIDNLHYINSIDYQLKTGSIEVDDIIDLLLIHIL